MPIGLRPEHNDAKEDDAGGENRRRQKIALQKPLVSHIGVHIFTNMSIIKRWRIKIENYCREFFSFFKKQKCEREIENS